MPLLFCSLLMTRLFNLSNTPPPSRYHRSIQTLRDEAREDNAPSLLFPFDDATVQSQQYTAPLFLPSLDPGDINAGLVAQINRRVIDRHLIHYRPELDLVSGEAALVAMA